MAVVERLLAVQAQDPRGARLAIRARSTGLSVADVDRELTERRSLLITWLNRGTLHLVRREDYPWLQALTTPPLRRGIARRLAQEGVSPDASERGVELICRVLASEGPLDRDRLRQRLAAANVPTKGQAFVHLLGLAAIRGLIVRGPMLGRKHALVLVRDWIGEPGPVDRGQALTELARRYLAGHGPADARDLAKWAGLPLRDARTGLEAIAPALEERADGLVELRERGRAAPLPEPRLLGSFEPVLLGWRSRRPVLGDDEPRLVRGGMFRPFALVGGQAQATWTISRQRLVIEPFRRLARADRAALEIDAGDLERFLSDSEPRGDT